MKVYVSVDMEGVSGLTDPDDMRPGGGGYALGQELMTGDANAAVGGAFEAGAAEVLVNDSHYKARNLRLDLIDPRCRVIRGRNRPLRMGQGLDGSFAAALLVGYHSRAGADTCGVLSHTWMGREVENIWLNGRLVGEIGIVAALAGSLEVPVALVTGDEAVCEEARLLLKDAETVAVKRGLDRFSAELVPPEAAQGQIHAGSVRALKSLDRMEPWTVGEPVTLGVEWNSTTLASTCALMPRIEQAGPRHVEYVAETMTDAVQVLGVMSLLAAQLAADSGPYG
ncbi:MAG: D-aminopeptidase [Actinomycetia bacterium]|nr:D-aminopeptidase [Actinomycetes bacterium]